MKATTLLKNDHAAVKKLLADSGRTTARASRTRQAQLLLSSVVMLILVGPILASAQSQSEEKILFGQVQTIDPSGTEITLTDGTKLLTPPGVRLRPGALEEGMVVVATYLEQDNGDKILTRLARRPNDTGPAAPSASPKHTL